MPTADTEAFTGVVAVSDWNAGTKYAFFYENGALVTPENNGRTAETVCTEIYTFYCIAVYAGGELQSAHCDFAGTTTECVNTDAPTDLAPDDYDEPSGGSSDNSNLCPHPFIEGQFVPCDICVAKDQYGNCIESNPGKLCEGSIYFIPNSEGFVAQVEGLGAFVVHDETLISFNVEFGTTCVTMYSSNGNTFGASHYFAIAYNSARDELDDWLQTRNPITVTTFEIQSKLNTLLNSYLAGIGKFSKSKCTGSEIPLSKARYDLNCL